MAQQVKGSGFAAALVRSQQRHGFDAWPSNFRMLQGQPKEILPSSLMSLEERSTELGFSMGGILGKSITNLNIQI